MSNGNLLSETMRNSRELRQIRFGASQTLKKKLKANLSYWLPVYKLESQ
jgi:hypothetical protein